LLHVSGNTSQYTLTINAIIHKQYHHNVTAATYEFWADCMNAEVYITNPNSNTVGTFSRMNLLNLLMYLGYINLKQTYLADENLFYNATECTLK
jgi:hypothetical protein